MAVESASGLHARAAQQCRFCPSRSLGLCAPFQLSDIEGMIGIRSEDLRFAPRGLIYAQGDPQTDTYIMQQGWVALASLTASGERRILDFAVRGDVIGFHGDTHQAFNHAAECLTSVRVCRVPVGRLREAMARRPDLAMRVAQLAACSEVRAQDHLMNVGARHARERIAHLLLTLFARVVGRTPERAGETMELPLRLIDLGEAAALTPVHVSRVLKQLRLQGICDARHRTLIILDPIRLVAAAGMVEADAVFQPPRRSA